MPSHVTAASLQQDGGHAYLGRRMRIACEDDFYSARNPGGIVLSRPSLRRSTAPEVPTYGEQVIEPGIVYSFCGAYDGRTFVFVNERTRLPLQIYCSELPGAVFILEDDE